MPKLGSKGFCRQKCHFSFVKNADFVENNETVLPKNKRSMRRVTNYNVTSDIHQYSQAYKVSDVDVSNVVKLFTD